MNEKSKLQRDTECAGQMTDADIVSAIADKLPENINDSADPAPSQIPRQTRGKRIGCGGAVTCSQCGGENIARIGKKILQVLTADFAVFNTPTEHWAMPLRFWG